VQSFENVRFEAGSTIPDLPSDIAVDVVRSIYVNIVLHGGQHLPLTSSPVQVAAKPTVATKPSRTATRMIDFIANLPYA
jgi:hypothetical protein